MMWHGTIAVCLAVVTLSSIVTSAPQEPYVPTQGYDPNYNNQPYIPNPSELKENLNNYDNPPNKLDNANQGQYQGMKDGLVNGAQNPYPGQYPPYSKEKAYLPTQGQYPPIQPYIPGQASSQPDQFQKPPISPFNNQPQGSFSNGEEGRPNIPNSYNNYYPQPNYNFGNTGNEEEYEHASNETASYNETSTPEESQTSSPTSTSKTSSNSTSEEDDGMSESLGDFVIDKVSAMFDSDSGDTCAQEMKLDKVCQDITTEVNFYFSGNYSVQNILKDVFRENISKGLTACPRGSWCLDQETHMTVRSRGWDFKDNYCRNVSDWSMRGCLDKLKQQHPECMDKKTQFMYDAVNLLCNMFDTPFMEIECYTRTKKALYVLYKELEQQEQLPFDVNVCSNYTVELMRMYLCADDACHYDQQQMILSFPPFNQLGPYGEMAMLNCNASQDLFCQGANFEGDYYFDYDKMYDNDYDRAYDDDYYEDEDDNYDDSKLDMDHIIEEIMSTVQGGQPSVAEEGTNGYSSQGGEFPSEDRALFVGLVAAVVVLSVGFLLLLVLGIKRFRSGPSEGVFPVYTKLANEDEINGLKAEF